MHFVKCKWYEPFECVNVLWACPKMKPLPQLNELITCFDKINEIRRSKPGSGSDPPFGSGRGFGSRHFEKENLIKQ